MQTVETALSQTAGRLAEAGIETARLDARLLLGQALGLTIESVLRDGSRALAQSERRRLKALLRRRAGREPMAHILETREFWSLPFHVSPATLIPRPDSETLVEAALAHVPSHDKPLDILDLGTGSGCLLLTLLHELPRARGVGIDRSAAAITVAQKNANGLALSERASFVCADWAHGIAGSFDLIVCNPPYIREDEMATLMPEVANFEPRLALDGGVDGLESYRSVISSLKYLLTKSGFAIFEIGSAQAETVADLLLANRLQVIEIKEDLSHLPRCVVASLSRG